MKVQLIKSINEIENVIDGMYDYLNKNNLVKDSPLPEINKDALHQKLQGLY